MGEMRPGDESFMDQLARAFRAADEALRRDYDRSLSVDELSSDRWERAERLGFGPRASIYGSALVYGDVHVAADTWVGPWVLLDGSAGRVAIGESCSISAGVHIYTHDTVGRALSGGVLPVRSAPVDIGSRCYVGPHSIIAAGVSVGAGLIIGANSFVSESVPASSFAAGSPARVLGTVVVTDAGFEIIRTRGTREELQE